MKDYKERFKSINKEMMWVANEEVDDVIHFMEQLISERDKEWQKEKVKQLTPPEKWKQCLKIGTGQDEMCMMCGFNPKELINLLQIK